MRKVLMVAVAVLMLGVTGCKGGADAVAELGLDDDGATGATGGVPADCVDQTGGPATISMVNFAFDPTCVQVSASEGLSLVNEDQSAHRFILEGGAIDEVIDAGETVKVKSLSDIPPGTYSFNCGFHAPMKGTMIVQ
jgi:plastocyanin